MRPAQVVEIVTPKKYILNGLWFGPQKPKRAIILVHGMFSSAFSMNHVAHELLDNKTAVLTFNNRGHDAVTDVKQMVGNERKYHPAGTAHEIFTESSDDLEGAVRFAKHLGAKEVFLAGHSTGCQKSIYYAHKTGAKQVNGIILLAPLSDYASDRKKPQLRRAVALAKKLIKAGKPSELLPPSAWWHVVDAQRLISLYTPDSAEEIFSYSQTERDPKIYKSVKHPLIAIFAGADEYAERPAEKIAEWFKKNSRSRRYASAIIPKVGHSFREGEKAVAQSIKDWIAKIK